MQTRVEWVLIIFGTQVLKKKRPVRPVFPSYLSVSYDCDMTNCDIIYSVNSFDRNLTTLWACELMCCWFLSKLRLAGATFCFAKLFLGIHDIPGYQLQQ